MGINRFVNGIWTEIKDLQGFRNGAWTTAELRRYTGSEWELLWPCHFTYEAHYPLSGYIVTTQKNNPSQISSETLVTGPRATTSSAYIRDSLLFFPMEQMVSDLAGSSILKATLTLKRMPRMANDGEDTAYVNVGCALTGADPSTTGNTWNRNFTKLNGSAVGFARGKTKNISLKTSGITALLNGTADCLCLPTTSEYFYNSEGFGHYDPASTVLNVTYYI